MGSLKFDAKAIKILHRAYLYANVLYFEIV